MPLDSFTLEWFRSIVFLPKNITWSNLECGDVNTEYSYIWIQKKIREYLDGKNNATYIDENEQSLTPFEAEFYIWPEQQFKRAYKSITDQIVKSNPNYYDEELYNSCEELIRKIQALQNKLNTLKQ